MMKVNQKLARICVTVFVIICATMMASINLIPRGNFIFVPAVTSFIYTPLIIIQVFLVIQVWIVEKTAIRAINWTFYSSLLVTLIFSYWFYKFLTTTS